MSSHTTPDEKSCPINNPPMHFGLSLCIRSDIGYEPDCSEDFFNGSYTISDEAPPFWDPNTP